MGGGISSEVLKALNWLRDRAVAKVGNRAQLAGYEQCSLLESIEIKQDSPDTQYLTENNPLATLTIKDGTEGTAWTKVLSGKVAMAIQLDQNWRWVNGKPPTIKAPFILVCHWNGNVGIASVMNGAE